MREKGVSMKEYKLIATLLLTFGLAFAPMAVLAQTEKGEEGSQNAPHDAKGDHAPGGGKATKKADTPKAQSASEKPAVHAPGDSDPDDDEAEEGSH